jgi:23S rRNA pseudouridine1911/1915/1917 synthase
MKKIFTVAVGDPPTLGEAVRERVGAVDVARGGVHVDGKRCVDPAFAVAAGMRVVVHLDDREQLTPKIVFEDNWLLVADKPSGMASQASRADVAGSLEAWAQARNGEARLVHRLDRDASGLIVISQAARARTPLAEALAEGKIIRRYLARVVGPVEGEGVIALRIARDSRDERKRRALPENDNSGEAARTRWKALSPTLVELELETGRTHQIRVHLSAIGQPIVGDTLYGGAKAERLMLHAHSLALPHPRDNRPLSFESPSFA